MDTAGSNRIPVGLYKAIDLLRMAAKRKGTKLAEGASRAYTEPFASVTLDAELLAKLDEAGIKQQPRPDGRGEIFTLVDTGPQRHVPGYAPSNIWNVLRKDTSQPFDMTFELFADLDINETMRGVVFTPKVSCQGVWATDPLPRMRMFRALAEHVPYVLNIVRELAASDGAVVVSWTEMNLGGLRSVSALFDEFAKGNGELTAFACRERLFEPDPHPPHVKPGDEPYVAEPFQPALFKQWHEQLDSFRAKIAV